MRHNKKFYISSKEKEILKMDRSLRRGPLESTFGPEGDYVELKAPVLDGYDLIAEIHIRDKSLESALNEVLKFIYPRPLHSSGKEFRECDVRKSLKYRPRKDPEYKSFFVDGHLNFDKCKNVFTSCITHRDFMSLSENAKKLFYTEKFINWRGKEEYNHYIKPEVINAPYTWVITPHYRYYEYILNRERLSYESFINDKLFGSGYLYYKYKSFSYKDQYKKYYRRQEKCKRREEFVNEYLHYNIGDASYFCDWYEDDEDFYDDYFDYPYVDYEEYAFYFLPSD